MKRKFRLRKRSDIQLVRKRGKAYSHPLVVLIAAPTVGSETAPANHGQTQVSLLIEQTDTLQQLPDGVRVAIIAGRRIGNAVLRNRAKRQLRAVISPFLNQFPPGWDLLILARKPICQASFSEIQSAIIRLLQRAKLLNDPYES